MDAAVWIMLVVALVAAVGVVARLIRMTARLRVCREVATVAESPTMALSQPTPAHGGRSIVRPSPVGIGERVNRPGRFPERGLPYFGGPRMREPVSLPHLPDATADSIVDGARFGGLAVRAAAVRGPRARRDGEQREHAVSISVLHQLAANLLLSVVSHGVAGPFGHVAAASVGHSVYSALTSRAEQLDELWRASVNGEQVAPAAIDDVLLAVVGHIRDALAELTRRHHVQGPGATADIACLLTRLGDASARRHLAFGFGDAEVLKLGPDGAASLYSAPAGGPLRSDPTTTVTHQQLVTGPGEVVVLTMRSTSRLLRGGAADRDGVLRRWAAEPVPTLTGFLWDLTLHDGLTNGDRAAVALWERPEETAVPTVHADSARSDAEL